MNLLGWIMEDVLALVALTLFGANVLVWAAILSHL